jgi:4-amino-4-deoxy-L-arabinose transferase-like glycosyltransferase
MTTTTWAPTAISALQRPRKATRAVAVTLATRSAVPWLALLCAVQVALAYRSTYSRNAFDDEGLYVFMGHRVIHHLLTGEVLREVPGSYFSGSPSLYPVMAAMADSVGGLQAARGVSLFFAMVATLGTYGIGARLYGRLAGLLGACAFVLCGPVIYQSHLAVYDSTMMGLLAVSAWLAVRDAQHRLLWAPAIGALLTLAGLVKYAGLVYAPMVALLAATVAWPHLRWAGVRRSVVMLCATAATFFFVVQLWGRDLIPGIKQTTLERHVITPSSPWDLTVQVVTWVGPWLLLAVVAAVVRPRREWALSLVLLCAAVVGPLQQLRIGEAVSLSKHVAFGMVFAAPLVGSLLAGLLRRGWRTVPAVALVLGILAQVGLPDAQRFLTGWVDDRDLRPVLTKALAADPGKPILGERPSPQRYELRAVTQPRQWNDTYEFSYAGLSGKPAYAKAIDQGYFGVIYLSITTDYGAYVHNYLTYLSHQETYRLSAKVPRYLRGKVIGDWLVYTKTPDVTSQEASAAVVRSRR